MSATSVPRPFCLHNLPLPVRLTLAVFLISVGLAYLSALVQLHLQHASPGSALPTPEDAVRIFHGDRSRPVSAIERLLIADESQPFNGSGEMVQAFTKKSEGWKKAIKDRAKQLGQPNNEAAAEQALRNERLA